jgi:hypothetical protein
MDWTVQRSNPGGAEIFVPLPTGTGGHPASRTTGTGSFPGVKRSRRDVNHPPTSSAEVKERVKVYLYSPSGFSWLLIRRKRLPPPNFKFSSTLVC